MVIWYHQPEISHSELWTVKRSKRSKMISTRQNCMINIRSARQKWQSISELPRCSASYQYTRCSARRRQILIFARSAIMEREGRLLKFILHFSIFIFYVAVIAYDVFVLTPDMVEKTGKPHTYGGRFKYLTFWDILVQCVFFGLSAFTDVLAKRRKDKLERFTDFFFTTLALPLGMFVFVSFWGLYAIDRELIYPKALDSIIPQWLNHAWHTTILPLLFLDSLVVKHRFPNKKTGVFTLAGFGCIYQAWLFWIKYAADIWVYPVFAVLNAWQIALFLLLNNMVMAAMYLVGETAHTLLWGIKKKSFWSMKSFIILIFNV